MTSQAFLGMTAHWINVKTQEVGDGMTKGIWTLKSAVIGFRGISGGHDGENMGRYFMGVTDRVGITGKNHLKVSHTHGPVAFPGTDDLSCLSQLLIMHQATARLAKPSKRSTTSISWNNGTLRKINIRQSYGFLCPNTHLILILAVSVMSSTSAMLRSWVKSQKSLLSLQQPPSGSTIQD